VREIRRRLDDVREAVMPEYFGVSKDALQLILQGALLAIQAVGLAFLVIGAMRALHELRSANAAASHRTLETMLKEWRSAEAVAARDRVLQHMPLIVEDGVEEKIAAFAMHCSTVGQTTAFTETLVAARQTVQFLNDLGAYVENGVVSQRLFLGHFHLRVIELTTLLEPYVLYVTGQRGTRWGIRLLRLKAMGLAYHEANEKHRPLSISLRGSVLYTPRRNPPLRLRKYWRRCCRTGTFGTRELAAVDEEAVVFDALNSMAAHPNSVRISV
jgi:hypothetical protein